MADDHPVQLDQIRGVVSSLRAIRFILMRANTGDDDVVDLILARAVDGVELRFHRRQVGVLGLWRRHGHDIGGLLGESKTGLLADRISHDDRIFATNTKTVVPVPAELSHGVSVFPVPYSRHARISSSRG